MTSTYYVENLGCAKNQVDAEIMIAVLDSAQWRRVGDPGDAAVIIVNTCGFIDPAKEESIDATLSFRREYPSAKIVMAGCLTERYAEALSADMPEADGIFGNRAPEEIAGFLDTVLSGNRAVYRPKRRGAYPYRAQRLSFPGSAFVKVSEGCRNRCSFCAIPLIRGGLQSRTVAEIVNEIRRLVDEGVFEVNLVAQDLSAFGLDRGSRELIELLTKLSHLESEFWIRMLYVYPETFPSEVLDLCRDDPRFLPYFDIPMQHASRAVLSRMGRPGSREGYLQLIRRIRGALPSAVIRTSFLVGFIGEGEEEFAELLRFQREAELDWAGTFTYSVEEGTPAFAYRDEVPPAEVAAHRKEVVDVAQEEITARRLEAYVGRKLDLLVEERVQGESLALARAYAHAPEVDGAVILHTAGEGEEGGRIQPGTVVPGVVLRRNGVDLEARPAD